MTVFESFSIETDLDHKYLQSGYDRDFIAMPSKIVLG